jgi:hypothetical protein
MKLLSLRTDSLLFKRYRPAAVRTRPVFGEFSAGLVAQGGARRCKLQTANCKLQTANCIRVAAKKIP